MKNVSLIWKLLWCHVIELLFYRQKKKFTGTNRFDKKLSKYCRQKKTGSDSVKGDSSKCQFFVCPKVSIYLNRNAEIFSGICNF